MSRDIDPIKAAQYRRETEKFLSESLAPPPPSADTAMFIAGLVVGAMAMGIVVLFVFWLAS